MIERYTVHDGTGMINYAAFIANISAAAPEIIHSTKSRAVFTDSEKDQMLEAVT